MLESQVVVNCPKWVLGIKLPSSEEQLELPTAEVISTDLRGCFVLSLSPGRSTEYVGGFR